MGLGYLISDIVRSLSVGVAYAEAPPAEDTEASGTDEEAEGKGEVKGDDGESEDGEKSDEKSGEDGGEEGGDEEKEESSGGEQEEEEAEAEEPVDLKPKLEEECAKSKQCVGYKHHYDECAERVKHQEEENGKPSEDCVEEFFHLMHCATQCAAPKLWANLK